MVIEVLGQEILLERCQDGWFIKTERINKKIASSECAQGDVLEKTVNFMFEEAGQI